MLEKTTINYESLKKEYDEKTIAKIKTAIEEVKSYYDFEDTAIEEDIEDVFISEDCFYFFTQFTIIRYTEDINICIPRICILPIFNTIDKIEISKVKDEDNNTTKKVLWITIGDNFLSFYEQNDKCRLNEIVKKYFIKNIKKQTVMLITDHSNVHIDDMTIDYNQNSLQKRIQEIIKEQTKVNYPSLKGRA